MAKYIDAERYINNLRELRTGDKDTVYEYYDDGIDVAISEAAIFPVVDIPRWIPVTERLPEEDGRYLVTCEGEYRRVVMPLSYRRIRRRDIFYDHDIEYGDIEYCGVIAWMPLPEPYKGGEEE